MKPAEQIETRLRWDGEKYDDYMPIAQMKGDETSNTTKDHKVDVDSRNGKNENWEDFFLCEYRGTQKHSPHTSNLISLQSVS